ncbi:MAG: aldo/keto reductase [Holophagaceae bacterium]|nr:aldo/keto reductase [Holophagaceae bacterium]
MASQGRKLERRDLFRLGAAATAGLLAQRLVGAAEPAEQGKGGQPPPARAAMPTRNLGRTGHRVCLFSLGGQAALEQPRNEKVALPIIERALDLGVNYFDTSARYGGEARWSERYFGEVMAKRRGEAFLATKTHDRTRDGSLRILDESLKLLRTDHVDLWQLHAMSTMDDVDRVFAKGGALEAFHKAKEQKLVRFLGITGHTDPDVLAEAIRRFPFDTVLMAFNAAGSPPPALPEGPAAPRRGEGHGHHRHEDPRPGPAAGLRLPGRTDHAGGPGLRAVPGRLHRHRRRGFPRPAGGGRGPRQGLHAPQPGPARGA